MLSRTVIRSNELNPCGRTPMRRTMSRFFLVTSIPRTLTLPDVGVRMVSMISTVVVFPAPLGPRNANTSPFLTVNDTSLTASKFP